MTLPSKPNASLIKRNPHIYGDAKRTTQSAADMLKQFPAVKTQPQKLRGSPSGRVTVPPLVCAKGGFIRQSSKPLLNKLEAEWLRLNERTYPNYPPIRAQARRYKIGNGAWYKPDFTCSIYPGTEPCIGPSSEIKGGCAQVSIWSSQQGRASETAWEIKGGRGMKGQPRGLLALKSAAHQWPEVRFILCWKKGGVWMSQRVNP